MSWENDQTVEIYQSLADQYLLNTIKHDAEDIVHAQKKQHNLQTFIYDSLFSIPENAAVFEIGSGDGEIAYYLQSVGFEVTASDVADGFLEAIRKKGVKAIKYNVLKDPFPGMYYGVVCWRVFVHFTPDDARNMLNKTFEALKTGGRLVFNAMNHQGQSVEEEWVDFQGSYHMGQKRYYHYFDKEDLREMIQTTGFRLVHFHYEGGTNGKKWLVFVVEK